MYYGHSSKRNSRVKLTAQVSQLLEVCIYSYQKKSELTLQAALKYTLAIEWEEREN